MKQLIALLALSSLAACTSDRDPLENGRAQYLAAGCAACHAVNGRGGRVGPDLSLVGFRRNSQWLDQWLQDPKGWKHDARMPGFKLDSGTRKAVVAYLASLQQWDGAETGKAIYAKAGCIACHGIRGQGGHPNNNVKGDVIPALDAVVGTYTREELVAKIRRGAAAQADDPSKPEPLVHMPAWGKILSDKELDAVAAYLETIAIETPEEEEW